MMTPTRVFKKIKKKVILLLYRSCSDVTSLQVREHTRPYEPNRCSCYGYDTMPLSWTAQNSVIRSCDLIIENDTIPSSESDCNAAVSSHSSFVCNKLIIALSQSREYPDGKNFCSVSPLKTSTFLDLVLPTHTHTHVRIGPKLNPIITC